MEICLSFRILQQLRKSFWRVRSGLANQQRRKSKDWRDNSNDTVTPKHLVSQPATQPSENLQIARPRHLPTELLASQTTHQSEHHRRLRAFGSYCEWPISFGAITALELDRCETSSFGSARRTWIDYTKCTRDRDYSHDESRRSLAPWSDPLPKHHDSRTSNS